MKHTLSFVFFVLAVIGLLYSISGKKYSRIPADAMHMPAAEISACMGCHGKGMEHSLKDEHPPKYECFECHKRKRPKRTA